MTLENEATMETVETVGLVSTGGEPQSTVIERVGGPRKKWLDWIEELL